MSAVFLTIDLLLSLYNVLVQVLLERGGGGSIVSEDGRHCFVFYIYICKQSVSLSPKMINVEGVEKMARGGGG
jgi:hypothetical protein